MNIVCIGAHPDDCECFAGGTCLRWASEGHRVLFVSTTNGDAGHHVMGGGPLAQRRALEARASAEIGGIHELILPNHDGELEPTLELRKEMVRIIRRWEADIVITHRPYDYHPDHRYTSVAVQDAAFMVTVPHFCPEMPRLERNPVFLYMADSFTKPVPFRADIAVDISEVVETKLDMLDAMESQMYEWLPWLENQVDSVPTERSARRQWLAKAWEPFSQRLTDLSQDALRSWYGEQTAKAVVHAEPFEICEYGNQPSKEELRRLFPFFPARRK
ncbi:MAG: PIG-L family deacetylase [Candidatus Hydrogenedentes bacterium]|nr:PIG-L family deacetylase [Candidatus Hydrogenedentota bacterium]